MRGLSAIVVPIAGALLTASAFAQLTISNVGGGFGGAGAAYSGPGDVVSSAAGWWGLRCYNNAYSGNMADIWDSATGLTTETLLTCSTGNVITATINSLATTCATACNIKILYDQSGNGHNATQAVNGSRPTYIASGSCGGGITAKPCVNFNGSQALAVDTTSLGVTAQPWTVSCVTNRTGNTGSFSHALADNANGFGFLWGNAVNTIDTYAGSILSNAASQPDNSFHAVQNVGNGGSSITAVDGTITTGAAGAGSITGTTGGVQLGSGSLGPMTGKIAECGLWASGFSNPTNISAMNTNQHSYWGF